MDNNKELDIDAIFAAAKRRTHTEDGEIVQDPQELLMRFVTLMADAPIKSGSLATWKLGMRDRRFPAYGDPCVVIAVFDEPVVDLVRDHSGEIVAMSVASAEIGVLDEDGDLETYLVDARRMRPWTGDA